MELWIAARSIWRISAVVAFHLFGTHPNLYELKCATKYGPATIDHKLYPGCSSPERGDRAPVGFVRWGKNGEVERVRFDGKPADKEKIGTTWWPDPRPPKTDEQQGYVCPECWAQIRARYPYPNGYIPWSLIRHVDGDEALFLRPNL